MHIQRNQHMLANQVTYSERDMVALAEVSIESIARLIAQKYVEQNYDELMKDQAFLAQVKDLAAKMTAEKVADHIERLIIPPQEADRG